MATQATKLFVRFRKRLRRDVEQIREGIYQGPSGDPKGGRGKVQVGRCGATIDASRSSNHLKNERVLVATAYNGASAIFRAPPGKPGPATVAAKVIKGAPFQPVQGQFAKFLVLCEGSPAEYEAFRADGEAIAFVGTTSPGVGVGTAILPIESDGLGQGTRISFANEFTDDASGDLVTVDFLGQPPDFAGGSTFRYTPPAPWVATSPQQVPDGSIYWIEHQLQPLGTETTLVRLRRSLSATWAPIGISTVGGSFVVESTVLTGPTLEWFEAARGPDYTDTLAALWVQNNVEDVNFFERVRVVLSTGSWTQRVVAAGEGSFTSVPWSGHPTATSAGITRGALLVPVLEDSSNELLEWDGDVEVDPSTWNAPGPTPVGSAVDVAPDPDTGIGLWIITGVPSPQIIHLNENGTVITAVDVDVDGHLGLAVLAGEGIFIPDPPPEE